MPVVAACPVEACTATAEGGIVIRGSSKRFKLRPATKQIYFAQGAKATLELTLRKTTLTAIRRALKQGKKVSAKLTRDRQGRLWQPQHRTTHGQIEAVTRLSPRNPMQRLYPGACCECSNMRLPRDAT